MKFSENLRNLRKEKDYSQEYLADRLGVSRQTISKWENATAMPDLKKLTEIAELFEIGINDLLGLDIPEDSDSENKTNTIKIEYSSQKLEADIQELERKNKTLKIVSIIISAAIVILSISFVLSNSALVGSIDSLRSQVNTIQPHVIYDDTEDKGDFNYDIIEINKEKPYLVTVNIRYSPVTISKDASVCFYINGDDGKLYKLDADFNNNLYSATGEVNVNNDGVCSIFIDDGETINKVDEEIFLLDMYFMMDNSFTFNYNSRYSFTPETNALECTVNDLIKITSAKFVIKNPAEKVLYQQDNLEINASKQNGDNGTRYTVLFDEIAFSNIDTKFNGDEEIYFELTDENGVKYNCYMYDNGELVDQCLKINFE